mmetsp:Transcript_11133/g.24868  ORF Transcript_11133/g.24868 Transcript_11133/m.24868 type:complete len:907 (-) Transcript_11133:104-2824(-)
MPPALDPAEDRALRAWAAQNLAGLLQIPAESCGNSVENIFAYDNPQDLKEFLGGFTEKAAEKKVNAFVEELFIRRRTTAPQGSKRQDPSDGKPGGAQGGRGGRRDEDLGQAAPKGRGRGGRGGGVGNSRVDFEPTKLTMVTRAKAQGDKRLIVIDAASGRHNILTNCLNCGKVIAEEEGWGPCLFCGNPLETIDDNGVRHLDDRGLSMNAGGSTDNDHFNASFKKAVDTKERLLSYDRDAKRRTKVYDDATDWYTESSNLWLSAQEREEALKKGNEEEKRQSEEKRKIHARIDLFGRTVIDTSAEHMAEEKRKGREKFQEWTENVNDSKKKSPTALITGSVPNNSMSDDSKALHSRLRASLHATGRDKSWTSAFGKSGVDTDGYSKRDKRWDASGDLDRVEDEFSGISVNDFAAHPSGTDVEASALVPVEETPFGDDVDAGMCLSLQQPWASLLIHGFKRVDGRPWATEHRGRLWIHAASSPVEDAEVDALEYQYRELYESNGFNMPPFPSKSSGYPTSALLGCVDLEECWAFQEYLKVLEAHPSMPSEEKLLSGPCDHILWCLRPRCLTVPVRMNGEKTMWKLNSSCLSAAQRGLRPVIWPCVLPRPPLTVRAAPVPIVVPQGDTSSPATGSAAAAASSASAAPRAARAKAAPQRARLDLWPKEAPSEILEVLERDRGSSDRDVVVLQNGFVQLVGFVPSDMQQRLVNEMREMGVSERGFASKLEVSAGLEQMYLGMHWDTIAQRWEPTRSDLDGADPIPMPKLLTDMYSEAVKRANREIRGQGKKRKLTAFPEEKLPNVGVVNFYGVSASMRQHQDTSESQAILDAGYAVMGICIGDSCEFVYGNETPSSTRKPKLVKMESGDVYLFGGESRLMWHGVSRILPRSAPPSLRLIPGRLNITLRVH